MNKRFLLVLTVASALLVAALSLAFSPVPVALAQGAGGNGVIEAQVVISGSATTNGLSNLPVSMFTYVNGQRQPTPSVSATDAQGRVKFEGLNTGDAYTYTVIVRYQESFYRAEHVAFPPGSTAVSPQIVVPAAATVPAGNGVIDARVVLSGSADTAAVGNLAASLFAFTGGGHSPNPVSAVTDARGRVRFDGLATTGDVTYTVLVQYQGLSFDSGDLKFPAGSAAISTTISVPPVSSDKSKVRIEQHHIVIDFDSSSRMLQIAEFYLTNSGSAAAYIGEPDSAANGQRVTMRVPLPPNAVLEGIDQRTVDQNVFISGNTLLDGMPIPPSGGSLIVSYKVPYDRSTFALAIASPYSTTALNILLAPGIGLRGQRLVSQGVVPDTKFTRYMARDLGPGSSLAVEITDLPAPFIPTDWLTWLPLAAAAVALVAILVYAARRRSA
ncbi:MAG: hypothetical protein HZB53_17760 [Chloroflexi bacterium]|nr:hypothetical protein [Chloroflexota bacterium]